MAVIAVLCIITWLFSKTWLYAEKLTPIVTRNIFKKDNPRFNGSGCCNMSLQKEFSICLSEAYQTTQNLTPSPP